MRILLLGGNGYLGPHVVRELERDHELVVTDLVPVDTPHESRVVDISDWDQVRCRREHGWYRELLGAAQRSQGRLRCEHPRHVECRACRCGIGARAFCQDDGGRC